MPKRQKRDLDHAWLYAKEPHSDASIEDELKLLTGDVPVWTDNKARFIMRYLRYFVMITKHGTYIDGFAGPQEECETESWAAKLVLNSEPRRLRHFHLCDKNKAQITWLEGLKKEQPSRDAKGRKLYRDINIHSGDFNSTVNKILSTGQISEKEATFCLIDQRTFECQWKTVETLAHYKKTGNKIELFYFLANGWLERAVHNQLDKAVLERWWGREDWTDIGKMTRENRCDVLVKRFKADLKYKSVRAWPIYERKGGGSVMYYMIHATDHPEAPKLMSRAYRKCVSPLEPLEQLKFELEPDAKTAPSPRIILQAERTA